MRTGPFENLRDFIPIIYILKIEMFYRRTRNNHSVELLILHQFKITVESFHVFHRRIF